MTFHYKKEYTQRCGDEDFVMDEKEFEYTPTCRELAEALADILSEKYCIKNIKGFAKFIDEYDLQDTIMEVEDAEDEVKAYFEDFV